MSWEPGQADVAAARRVIRFLEDRRVMFNVTELEDPEHCVLSVIEVRRFLTSELGNLAADHSVAPHLQAMRAACRRFLDTAQEIDRRNPEGLRPWGLRGYPAWEFDTALGELRHAIGIHVAQLAGKYGLDVEEDLASILPPPVEGDDEEGGNGRWSLLH